jgi:hypothetical protein
MALGGKQVGTMGKSKVRGTVSNADAVSARKAASVAAGAAGGAPRSAAGKTGFGIMGNAKAAVDAYKTGGTKAAGKVLRERSKLGRNKPTNMY